MQPASLPYGTWAPTRPLREINMPRSTVVAIAMLSVASVASADPATPPEHNEVKYRSIGSGLYVDADDDKNPLTWWADENHQCDPSQTTCGITTVSVYSTHGIDTGSGRYVFDEHDEALRKNGYGYDGGKLGELTSNVITLDCVNQTYRLMDTGSGNYLWRAVRSLPALAPVFRYVCSRRKG